MENIQENYLLGLYTVKCAHDNFFSKLKLLIYQKRRKTIDPVTF